MAVGIGGMVGAGIFSILGVVAKTSGNALWVSFLIGGAVALLSTYSYAKLGVRYPSAGGAVEFLVKGLGDGLVSGGLNIFMWVGYVVTLALYATAFSGYAMTFLPETTPRWWTKAIAVAIVAVFALVNVAGAKFMGRAESAIVAIKLAILGVFAVAGAFFIDPSNLNPSAWPAPSDILVGAGILFVGYEGFGLITNTAGEMENPAKTLPRALYLSVASVIVIYVAVSITVIGNLPVVQIVKAEDFALAEAARPFLGKFGFTLVAIAALLSTSSAINATLFGGANVSYTIARDGELPTAFSRKYWGRDIGGLLITTLLVFGFILIFDLGRVAMMGSAAFLVVYAAVNAAHLRIVRETGARPSIIWASLITCSIMLVILCVQMWRTSRFALMTMLAALVLSFAGEAVYRKATGRTISAGSDA